MLAETEQDIAATVAFASKYNLRLAVKGTGHDWKGASTAHGGLLLWTHLVNRISFMEAFTPTGCSGMAPAAAAYVEAGVQFRELYNAAAQNNVVVMGGTCDSVGVGGCFLGGCWGTMSKMYGSAAANLLEARVVLADGSVVVANNCTHPDLFWSLRGGGSGVGGIVASFVVRTHTPPSSLFTGGVSFATKDYASYVALLEQVIVAASAFQAPAWGGGLGFGRVPVAGDSKAPPTFTASLYPRGFNVPAEQVRPMLQPLLDWATAHNSTVSTTSVSWSEWTGGGLPWMESHPDREISTATVAVTSRLPAMRALTPGGAAAWAQAWANMSALMPPDVAATIGVDFEKGQAGASDAARALALETSLNPILQDAMGLLLIAVWIPYLPTAPPNARTLSVLWPRLQRYAVLGSADSLWDVCQRGAGGDDAAAADCLTSLAQVRVPRQQQQVAAVREVLLAAHPNIGPDGQPLSGTYLNEADYGEVEWQRSFWGDVNYARLRAVKKQYDPAGFFICHHCVGSEDWTPDGNCPLNH